MALGNQYIGNPDFRGYLNYLSQNEQDPTNRSIYDSAISSYNGSGNYGFVDNNGQINSDFAAREGSQRAIDVINQAYNKYLGLTNDGSGGATGGGGGGGGYGGSNSADLAFLDTQEQVAKRLLKSTDSTLSSGLQGILDLFNKENSSVNQQRSRALEDFDLQRQSNNRGKNEALGAVNTNARTLADSVRRILGMAGGTGSSAYQLAAPAAIARQAGQGRSQALNAFGENELNLGLAEKRATDDFSNLLADLEAQRNTREQSLRAGVLQEQQGLNELLANIAGERAALQGGNVGGAQQPFLNKILRFQTRLDRLPGQFRNSYDLSPVNVQTPNLRDYVVDRAGLNVQGQSGGATANPYEYFLQRRRDDNVA